MSCDAERVTGYVDGLLDLAARAEVEAHLASCPACREQADFERELKGRLRGLAVPEPPARLEALVRRRLRGRGERRWLLWTLPFAAGLAALILWGHGAAPVVAWQLSRDHDHCFGMRRLPAKVWGNDPAHVAAWFEKQGTSLPVVPESAGGLELVGARYCPLIDRSVAHLYYAGADRHLSLYVVPGSVRFRGRRLTTARGNTVALMRVGGMVVGLVSEESKSVEAFRRALSTTVARISPAAAPSP